MTKYKGSCHCQSISFEFEYGEIDHGMRCNCSICKRRTVLLSDFVLSPEQLTIEDKNTTLKDYGFGTRVARHYFCTTCGILPFVQTRLNPGCYRVNLGCIQELDIFKMEAIVYDGQSI